MNVLVLSPDPERLARTFARLGDSWTSVTDKIDVDRLRKSGVSFVVSYGYRHILKPPIVEAFRSRIVNLHLSLLPWNRGADPNFWSFFEGTPKGVSIHVIDAGVDTGDILVQREVAFAEGTTLATSYKALRGRIEQLFDEAWPAIRQGAITPRPQSGSGTSHRVADKEPIFRTLKAGWDTPIDVVERLGVEHRRRVAAGSAPEGGA